MKERVFRYSGVAQVMKWMEGHSGLSSGAHDVIVITSPQKNDLCTEELRDRAKSLDEVSLSLRKARFGCLFFGGEKELWS